MMQKKQTDQKIYTIGHSTRPIEEFINLLKNFNIQLLADVRTLPGSKRVPQYNLENMEEELKKEAIDYVHLKALGGLRHTTTASVNKGWRNQSFRGFADYMQTADFEKALTQLIELAQKKITAIMCAEAVPWRCHRSLIGDALLIRGWKVINIISLKSANPHQLTSFARADGLKITYPM